MQARPAEAWIFPEHAEITRLALDHQLPPELRAPLVALLQKARGEGQPRGATDDFPPLCQELTIPFARLAGVAAAEQERRRAAGGPDTRCIPWSTLPALAGDHALGVDDLRASLFPVQVERRRPMRGPGNATSTYIEQKPPLAWISFDVSQRFSDFLDEAPIEVSRVYRNSAVNGARGDESYDGMRRRFFRAIDVRLQATDPEYTYRAQGSRSHFQDASAPIEVVLERAAVAGDLDNALGQAIAHHLRSLQMALLAGKHGGRFASEAVLEHAFAQHFLQDAFAAGHIGTEHAVTELNRLRRHDYLNRVGLPVTRVMAVRGCNSATVARTPADERDHCWVAFGDGYLDGDNADYVVKASAMLAAQLALAFDWGARPAGVRESTLTGLIDACWPDEAPVEKRLLKKGGEFAPMTAKRRASVGPDMTLTPSAATISKHRVNLTRGTLVRVRARSDRFDTTVRVFAPDNDFEWGVDDATLLDTNAEATFEVPEDGEYEIVVTPQEPQATGDFVLTVDEVSRTQDISEANCVPLLASANLLDPGPPWTLPVSARTKRDAWTLKDRAAVARNTLRSVQAALGSLALELSRRSKELERQQPGKPTAWYGLQVALQPASAGATSGAQVGVLTPELVGRPLEPCKDGAPWRNRLHPFCDREGQTFRFGSVDASLIRPVLTIWPGPTSVLTSTRGEDSFGVGIAGQGIFGAGATAGIHRDVPWAISPLMLGLGLSGRFDSLLPGSRVNREVAGVNLAAFPMAFAGVGDQRYALGGFAEFRAPVWTLIGAITSGTSWDLFSVADLGPTGVRGYWLLPNRVPGSEMTWLGWDVEILNVRLGRPAYTARTASIGSAMDAELRVRLGRFKLAAIEPNFPDDHVFTLGVEVASGYSVFLWQKQ